MFRHSTRRDFLRYAGADAVAGYDGDALGCHDPPQPCRACRDQLRRAGPAPQAAGDTTAHAPPARRAPRHAYPGW